MAQPFSFGFSGDDIEIDADRDQGPPAVAPAAASTATQPEPAHVPAQVHNVAELLQTLPDKISYATQEIESPSGKILALPRRELFDVRVQLMAEDDGSNSEPVTGLDEADIRTNVYEGGFKTWECSIDLAKLLLDRGPRKDIDDLCRVDHVVELGCGTAIPTLVLFHHALTQSLPLYFTLADYNLPVLRLVTLPNLILTWASTLPADSPLFTPDTPNPFHPDHPTTDHGDLYLTPALVAAFQSALADCPLTLTLVSGSWAPPAAFLDLVPSSEHMNTFVLASETIYSPAALCAFADACVALLRRVRLGKALVAAKRVYFGVGGGVDAFKEEAAARGAVVAEVENSGVDMGEGAGVRRCLLEVQMM
ncbi:s-adenosylmethionine-dependent methyltransferase-like protein [Diplodia corticola]|uniref:protein-histidine N-methyltransferase n=1 Tax=Diplodia corticola TaxID=236234 RepID=A0A1J9RS22_9PEZI|nr:s-adenosylmethionine-dependent methyltransferase-like protein [Diplodia corticola]OJD35347.1 s-adenosylmethionine-dependent methyltransferase-like protein [Diplodia corticola]